MKRIPGLHNSDNGEAGFFSILAKSAGSRQRENQLTSTFVACFHTSRTFRQAVLEVLCKACRLKDALRNVDSWICDAQVAPPKRGRDKVDLRIRSSAEQPKRRQGPVLYLESKVESPLALDQLRKYRRQGAEYLIAITKHPPEVTERQLERIGAFSTRWQDIHCALLAAAPRSPIEHFVVRSFVDYLEDLGMARPEGITLANIEKLRRVLQKVRTEKGGYITPKGGFETADALLRLMGEVRRHFLEGHPELDRFKRYGPGFETFVDEDGDASFNFWWILMHPKRRAHKLTVLALQR